MGSIQERKSKDGVVAYTVTLRIKGHPTVCKTFSRKTDAKAWDIQERAKIQQGLNLEMPEARNHTLAEAIAKLSIEENIHKNRLLHLRRWRDALGARLLSTIGEVQVNDVAALWRRGGVDGKQLSNSTLNRHLNGLSLVFEAARRWGWTKVNPVRLAQKFREPRGRVRYLDDDERERLMAACRESSYRPLELIVLLALSSGMRKEELLGLTWKHVNLKSGTIILVKTKNGTERRVYVLGRALELLRAHALVRRIDTEFLFPGEKLSPRKVCYARPAGERHFDIRKPWERALEKAKLENFRFHDLRHSAASYLAMNGASIIEIAEVLGHKTLEVARRYSHLSDSHVAGVVEKMNERFLRG